MPSGHRFSFKNLDVYKMAAEHLAWTVQVAGRMPRGPFVVTNQAVGTALSIMGNIGEANGRRQKAGEVEQHYRYAQGSTFEAAAYLDALAALRVITEEEYDVAEERLARIAAMLTRLMQQQQRIGRARAREAPGSAPEDRAPRARSSKSGEAASKSREAASTIEG